MGEGWRAALFLASPTPHIPGAPAPHVWPRTAAWPGAALPATPPQHIWCPLHPGNIRCIYVCDCCTESKLSATRGDTQLVRNCLSAPPEIDIGLLTLRDSICKLNDSLKLVTFAVGLLAIARTPPCWSTEGLVNWLLGDLFTGPVYFILTDGHLHFTVPALPTKYPKIALLLLRSNLDLKNCLQQFSV